MNNNMKCPFCQQELESVLQLAGAGGLVEEAYLLCSKCNIRGERKLWQELIRTRKALGVSVDALKTIKFRNETYNRDDSPDCIDATLALDQINNTDKGE